MHNTINRKEARKAALLIVHIEAAYRCPRRPSWSR